MIKVAVASMLRDSVTFHGHHIGQVGRFFEQVCGQQGLGSEFSLSLYLVEGDSKDSTRDELGVWVEHWRHGEAALLTHDAGGPAVASLENPARFAALSAVANTAFRAARDSGADYVLWVESDLIFGDDLIASLMEAFGPGSEAVGAVAPLPWFRQNGRMAFYDTWAFRGVAGQRWTNGDLLSLKESVIRYRRMASVGCCALIDGNILRRLNADFGEGCFPALCQTIRDGGYAVVCDVETEIEHPSSMLVASRLV